MISPEQCRGARGFLDWSQDHLADKAHVSRQTVVDFERGERNPRAKSLKAMQDTLERHGIDFISSNNEGPAVRLRPSIWRLSPINPDSINWKASIYCGDLIIRAPSERRARQIASLALGIAVRRTLGQKIASNPWNRLVGEATCDRLDDPKYKTDSPEAIIFPEEYDAEWKA